MRNGLRPVSREKVPSGKTARLRAATEGGNDVLDVLGASGRLVAFDEQRAEAAQAGMQEGLAHQFALGDEDIVGRQRAVRATMSK
jgi:hypothetical protein